MTKYDKILKIIDKEAKYECFVWWFDDENADRFSQLEYMEQYMSEDYYYNWLNDLDRIRNEKISEILGDSINKTPKFLDIFPEKLKNIL